jgi:hypothetical protein
MFYIIGHLPVHIVVIGDRYREMPVSLADVHAVYVAGWLRWPLRIAVGLLLQIVYADTDVLEKFRELRPEIRSPLIGLTDVV